MKGLVFGRYQVETLLGEGGMGEVYLARSQPVGQPVILKVLKKDLLRDPRIVLQFLDEIRISAQLHHPNVISVFDTGEWQGELVMAMEFIPGHDLSSMLRQAESRGVAEFPVGVAAQVLADAAAGLGYVHSAADLKGNPLKVVHRDVSPQNLMVREDGLTKILDFGVARAEARAVRTLQGVVKGKLSYMAPEQLQGGELTGAADQFALGVVAWEMLTMQRLFRAERDVDTLQLVLTKVVLPPSELAPHVPQELDAVVLRMLDRDAQLRFPSCADAAQAFLPFAAGREAVAGFQRELGLPSPKNRPSRTAETVAVGTPVPRPSPGGLLPPRPSPQRVPPGLERLSDASPTEATRSLRPVRPAGQAGVSLDAGEAQATDRHLAMPGQAGREAAVGPVPSFAETEGALPRVETLPGAPAVSPEPPTSPQLRRSISSPSISITEPAGHPGRPGSGPNRTVLLRADAEDARSTQSQPVARASEWKWWHWALLCVGALGLGVGAAVGALHLLAR